MCHFLHYDFSENTHQPHHRQTPYTSAFGCNLVSMVSSFEKIVLHLYQEHFWFSDKTIHVIKQCCVGKHDIVLLNSSIATMRMTKKVISGFDLHDAVS